MRRRKRLLAVSLLALAITATVVAYQSAKSQAVVQITPPNLFGEPQQKPAISPPGQALFRLNYQRRVDLRTRIDPKATAVTIVQKGPEGFRVEAPDGMDFEEFMTRLHEAAALVTIVRKEGHLTPEADWINSNVTAQVLDVLKPDLRGSIAQNGQMTFVETGGDMQIGITRVSAILEWAEPLQVGATYLVFMHKTRDGSLAVNTASSLRIEKDHVDGLTEYTKSQVNGKSSAAVIEAVRASRLSPRP